MWLALKKGKEVGGGSRGHIISEDQVRLSVVYSVRHLVVRLLKTHRVSVPICCRAEKLALGYGQLCEGTLWAPELYRQCGIQQAMPRGPHLFWIGGVFTPKECKRYPKTQAASTPIKSPGLRFLSFSHQNSREVNFSSWQMCRNLVQKEAWHALWNSMAEECFHPYHVKKLRLNDFHMGDLGYSV